MPASAGPTGTIRSIATRRAARSAALASRAILARASRGMGRARPTSRARREQGVCGCILVRSWVRLGALGAASWDAWGRLNWGLERLGTSWDRLGAVFQ